MSIEQDEKRKSAKHYLEHAEAHLKLAKEHLPTARDYETAFPAADEAFKSINDAVLAIILVKGDVSGTYNACFSDAVKHQAIRDIAPDLPAKAAEALQTSLKFPEQVTRAMAEKSVETAQETVGKAREIVG
jgi:HEPN domain-containing protein